ECGSFLLDLLGGGQGQLQRRRLERGEHLLAHKGIQARPADVLAERAAIVPAQPRAVVGERGGMTVVLVVVDHEAGPPLGTDAPGPPAAPRRCGPLPGTPRAPGWPRGAPDWPRTAPRKYRRAHSLAKRHASRRGA